MTSKIMIIDDDKHISELIALYLNKEGYETKEYHSGKKAVEEFSAYSPHLLLLDLMLPERDGYQICSDIRKISTVPIIMITAKGETFDKVLGLELGADDFIVKPFDPKEMVARVKAVLRRYDKSDFENLKQIVMPNLTVNEANRTVTYRGKKLDMPPKEFELLYFLAQHPNQVFSREQLLDKIWGYEFAGDTRTVDVHVKRLREKLSEYEEQWSIATVWGIGYKFSQ